MRIPWKTVLRELLELGGHPAELVNLPRGRAIVIDEAKQCLFLTTKMAVVCPRKKSLRPYQQSQIAIHATAAWSSIVSTTTSGKFIEPNRCRQISSDRQCAKGSPNRIARIEAFGTVGHVGLVGGEIIEPSPRCRIPEVRDRWEVRRIASTNRIEFLKPRHRHIGPITVEIQIAFRGTRPVCERQIDILESIQSARPPLRRPGFVKFLDGSVLCLQPR